MEQVTPNGSTTRVPEIDKGSLLLRIMVTFGEEKVETEGDGGEGFTYRDTSENCEHILMMCTPLQMYVIPEQKVICACTCTHNVYKSHRFQASVFS